MTDNTKADVKSNHPFRLISIALLIAIISIIISAVTLTLLQRTLHHKNDEKVQLEHAVNQLKSDFSIYQEKTETAIAANEKNIAIIVNQMNNPSRRALLVEANYLIRMANLHLVTENNIALATQLLKMAAEELQPISEAALQPLKQALNTDVQTLSAIPQVDIPDLIHTIDALNIDIKNLNLHQSNLVPSASNKIVIPVSSSTNWWEKVKTNLSGLKSLFIVHRIDEPMMASVAPEQSDALKMKIQLKLAEAEWALLTHNSLLFQQSLHTAAEALTAFNQNQPSVNDMIKKLESLATINIKPNIPKLLSLTIINSLLPITASTPTEAADLSGKKND